MTLKQKLFYLIIFQLDSEYDCGFHVKKAWGPWMAFGSRSIKCVFRLKYTLDLLWNSPQSQGLKGPKKIFYIKTTTLAEKLSMVFFFFNDTKSELFTNVSQPEYDQFMTKYAPW